jgi:Fe-Mn family superoxide dismutase
MIKSLNSLTNFSQQSGTNTDVFKLVPLPWERNALTPFMSEDTITLIYDGYYRKHVEQLNTLARQYPELQQQSVAQIVNNYPKGTPFNNIASEILNHQFFFRCLAPVATGAGTPSGRLYQTIVQQFQSFENFVLQFTERAVNHFGSGWVWLVFDPTTSFLNIVDGDNAYNPIIDGQIALMTLDLWEHAFILDHGVDKRSYVNNFWNFINWVVIEQITSESIFGYQVRVG